MSNRLTKGKARVGSLSIDSSGGVGFDNDRAIRKIVALPFTNASTAENDTTFDVPSSALIHNVWVKITTASSAAGKLSVGLLSTTSGDADGFIACGLLEDSANEVFYSAASLWEIAIKASRRKADFKVDLALLRPALAVMGLLELPVSGANAEKLASLPPIHRDPFDRMLVAQSLSEPLILLTNDTALAAYGESIRVV